uniref:Pre-mRNA-splicing factor 3 domain-containing protein n=1 Tax=Aplanochytrium stocchinoi TaxID=215587 RepID=A0A6S8E5W9_9STRA
MSERKRKSRFGDAAESPKKKTSRFGPSLDPSLASSIQQQMLNVQRTLDQVRKVTATAAGTKNASVQQAKTSLTAAPVLRLNEKGQAVDAQGNVIELKPVSTLRMNAKDKDGKQDQASTRTKSVNPYLQLMDEEENKLELEKKSNREGDVDIEVSAEPDEGGPDLAGRKKKKRMFKFVEQGKYTRIADHIREKEAKKAYIEMRQQRDARRHYKQLLEGNMSKNKIPDAAANTTDDLESNIDLTSLDAIEKVRIDAGLPMPIGDKDGSNASHEPALMEWWDLVFLPKEVRQNLGITGTGIKKMKNKKETNNGDGKEEIQYDYSMLDLTNQSQPTFKLVEHPKSIKLLVEKGPTREIPLYLTKKEKKKKRRQMRMEAHQEMQDKVAMGLIPPPKPKIKLSNMMRALTNKSVAAPSAMTKEVLEGIEERKKDHEMRNLAAKKTPAEKWAKKKEKILEDSKGPIVVALFKVENMCEPPSRAASLRFKLDVNAQKMDMSGCALCVREPLERLPDGTRKTCNLIIFEGGEKRIKKIRKVNEKDKMECCSSCAASANRGDNGRRRHNPR